MSDPWIFQQWAKGLRDWKLLEAGPPKPKADNARGLVVPGYKYLGPGNGLDKGEPVNQADAAAQRHDQAYQEQLDQGDNPYLKYNHADEAFQKELEGDTSLAGNAANAVFQAKKRILEPLGLVEPKPEGTLDKFYPKVKKPRLEAAEAKPIQQPPLAQPGAGAGVSTSDSVVMAEGGGGPMADDNQGAEGVGNSSGDWHCDTQWMGDHVITRSTRTWVLPTYGNHQYKPINHKPTSTTVTKTAYAGYATPWGYFDFNRFHAHFSPRDWQRLINNHVGIRPKALKFKLFNVQVKEVTTQDSTKTIANNLTSTVQVFADKDYQLPYVLGSATRGTFPPFPADVFMLPQYGYCTLQDNQGNFTDRSAFYCLEYFPSQMLRTGNNFEFQFKFEDVPFHSGWAQSQSIDRLMNPLIDQYLLSDYGTDSAGNVLYFRASNTDLSDYQRNWLGGPEWRIQTVNRQTAGANRPNISGDGASVSNSYKVQNRIMQDRPGFAVSSTYPGAAAGTSLLNGVLTFPQSEASVSATANAAVNPTIEDEIQGTNPYGNDQALTIATNTQNATTAPTTGARDHFGIMPGMNWSNRDIYLSGPIWAKIPDTDGHFHPNPRMGGFGLKHPPPQILIKNTPVPADPPSEFDPLPRNSFITEYSTGQVTVEMLWEVKKESSKRWNPEIQFTSNFGTQDPAADGIAFGVGPTGQYTEPRAIGTRYISNHL